MILREVTESNWRGIDKPSLTLGTVGVQTIVFKMTNRTLVLVLAALCAGAAVLSANAHHSRSNFDLLTLVELEGTVSQVHWLFPHTWIYLDVEEEQGQVQTWVMEGASPPSIRAAGVSEEHIRPGDRIKMRCHPLKDGSPGCVSGFVTPIHGDMARGHGVERAWN